MIKDYRKKYYDFFKIINELNKKNIDKNKFINIFFILKPHPYFIDKYKILDKPNYFLIIKIFFKFALLMKNLLVNLFKLKKVLNKKISSSYDYIIFSHLVADKKLFQNDFYFNEFIRYLKKYNKNYLIVYFQHLKEIDKSIFSKKKDYFFFTRNLNFFGEVYCFLHLIKLFIFYTFYPSIKFKYRLFILSEILDSQTTFNIKTYYQSKRLFKKINFSSVISTFEGFNFEKIIFENSKLNNKRVTNIGYQHAPIFNNYYNIFQIFKRNFFPDKILTTGKYYKGLFKKKIKKKIDVIEFGSNKIEKLNKKHNKKNICLVTPEAMESECIKMFQFCLDYVQKYNDITFLWRTHPLININNIMYKMNIDINKEKNIKISNNNNKDFDISKYCLFRGSTTVIKAIKKGCYPLYLDFPSEININILSGLKEVNSIKNINQLNKFVVNKNKSSNKLKIISKKIDRFFNITNLEKFKL